MEHAKLLTRDEMKSIKAGDDCCCGDIYCKVGGEQYYCSSGDCEDDTTNSIILDLCMSNCIDRAVDEESTCEGCAQFPVME